MIPNLVKGKGISGAIAYAMSEGYGEDKKSGLVSALGRQSGAPKPELRSLAEGEKSRADILGGQNFGFAIESAADVEMARRMMEWNGKAENQASRGRKCEKDCLHASLSWEKGQAPTRADMTAAAQGFLKALGMEQAQAVFIAHDDTEHKHLHIIASRIDPASGKTYSQADDFTVSQAWGLSYERQQGHVPQNEARRSLHKMLDAIETRDGKALADHLTERTPTFSARELDKALKLSLMPKEDREKFRSEILADKAVIGLRETQDAAVTRYTTRDVLASEMTVLRSAQTLAKDRSHAIGEARIEKTVAAYTLKPEQADALRHLTGAEGLGILWGEAGTGKSHTLKAVRAAYEWKGCKVIGMAPTNDVVQQMRGDGYRTTSTVDAALNALDAPRAKRGATWDKNTVLIVDEAAMISTKNLGRLAAAAADAGAKLILAGDDAQLPSIERGGLFETLRQRHGATILTDVQRVKTEEKKRAFNQMHEGEFRGALATFVKDGGLHWSGKQADALRDMAETYAANSAAAPDKNRFMFAFTNAEVAALNASARELHKQRGDLGEDFTLRTAHGEAVFAVGDRIQFSGNGYGQKAKNAGLTNGRVGTVTAIDMSGEKARMTVSLIVGKGEKPHEVSFVVGDDGKAGEFNSFKHGYAGTIYRGQGKTIDESLVLHSPLWRSAASYVALTRAREDVHIFASHETIRAMDRGRPGFDQVAAQTTLEPAGLAAFSEVRALDIMAHGLARTENKRAATAYEIGDHSALRIDFDDVARAATGADLGAPDSLRGLDRVGAFREAQRHNEAAAASPSAEASAEPPQSAEAVHAAKLDPIAEFLRAEQQDRELRKQVLQELAESLERMDALDQAETPSRSAEAPVEPSQSAEAAHVPEPDPIAEFLQAEQGDREARKQALQELAKVLGRDITSEDSSGIPSGRERDGGQSL